MTRGVAALLWPKVNSLLSARRAAKHAMWAAVATAIVSSISLLTNDRTTADWIGVALLLVMAWGIQRMSRVAAVVVLAWYVVGRIPYLTGASPGIMAARLALMAAWTLLFIHGVRATFAHSRLVKGIQAGRQERAAAEP